MSAEKNLEIILYARFELQATVFLSAKIVRNLGLPLPQAYKS